jgi:hypothetical protein
VAVRVPRRFFGLKEAQIGGEVALIEVGKELFELRSVLIGSRKEHS